MSAEFTLNRQAGRARFTEDLNRIAEKSGFDGSRVQTTTIPAVYPFVIGEPFEPKPGAIVTKILIGSPDPNRKAFPSVSKDGVEGPKVVYHVYDNGNVHWEYPKFSQRGEVKLFYCKTDEQVVEYFSGPREINQDDQKLKEGEARASKKQTKTMIKKEIDELKKGGNALSLMTSVVKRLYSGADIDIQSASYKVLANKELSVNEVQFGIAKKLEKADGKKLVFVPSGAGRDVDSCGWFIVSSAGSREKISPDHASIFVSTL